MNNTVKQEKKKITRIKPKKIYIPHYGLTEVDITNVVNELNEWALKPQSYSILNFCSSMGIHIQRYYDWVDRYPEIGEAHKIARTRINSRLIDMGVEKKTDPSILRLMRPMYQDRDIKADAEWEAKVKEDTDKAQPVQVFLDSFPLPKNQLENV